VIFQFQACLGAIMLRFAAVLLLLLGLLLSGATVLGTPQIPDAMQGAADQAKTAAQNSPALKSIGGLSLLWSTRSKDEQDQAAFRPFTAADLAPSSDKQVFFFLNTGSPAVTATYRFPGNANSTPLYRPGASSRIELPSTVNLFLVEFKWCTQKPNPCTGTQRLPVSYPKIGCPPTELNNEPVDPVEPCTVDVVFARELVDDQGNFMPAFVVSKYYLEVSEELIRRSKDDTDYPDFPTFTINGYTVKEYFSDDNSKDYFSRTESIAGSVLSDYAVRSGWESVRDFLFVRYPAATSCRPYNNEASKEALSTRRPDYRPVSLGTDNGITPSAPKVFDVFTLRQMLASTAAQLAGISGFTPGSITGAFGNIQGISTDTSYLSAQVTTVPTPIVSSTASSGNTGTSTLAGSLGQTTAVSGSNSTITCPPGTLPGVGTSGLPACVALSATTTTGTSGTSTSATGAGNVNGGTSTVTGTTTNAGTTSNAASSNTLGTTQQNSTTTTSGGQAGTVAPVPVSNALSAPTNVGVSAQDILAEQVQLNSQITNLRLALQGSLTDQYLIAQGKATGTRQQTTLGINISLNPPRRYKHAVAEVKIWVYPTNGEQPVSIVNLLPAAKTYNVAKITSSQKAFGAGVVIDPVNVGVAGGKSKNRLYLAKDTDTVALQYEPNQGPRKGEGWPNGSVSVGRSSQEKIRDVAREAEIWQKLSDPCAENPGPDPGAEDSDRQANPVVFGWQFRPVLGADYVQSGIRQVFAQLALPAVLGGLSSPKVYIQTRWREYDSKRQVVGAVYAGSCSMTENTDPLQVVSPLKVHTVSVNDMGSGILKVSAAGTFFSQGFSVLSGPTTLTPAIFDGNTIQFFANATNLLLTDDLKLVAEDGETTPFGVKPVPQFRLTCGISRATLHAVPRPDGNSLVEAVITSEKAFDLDKDYPPNPLFLIGAQVYGLHETPFTEIPPTGACSPTAGAAGKGVTCKYYFLASTDTLRSAQTFTARDLSWTNFKKTGTIEFEPSFTGLATLGTTPASGADCSGTKAKSPACSAPPIFTITGTDLQKIANHDRWNCKRPGCLELYEGLVPFTLLDDNFQVLTKTTAVLTLKPRAASPYFSLEPGAYKNKQKVSLSSTTAKATFFYTTDGQTPTEKSARYTGPIDVSSTETLKAIAVAENYSPSEVAKATYEIDPSGSAKPHPAPKPAPPLAAPEFSYKSYRFVWYPAEGEPIEWDLSAPQESAPGVTASEILNTGDSTQITFSGVNVLNDKTKMTFSFDNALISNPIFSYDATKKTLKFFITTAMTSKPGHKEIILNGYTQGPNGKLTAAQVLLPFDVTKR
jgi:Chitobiase/beta-hexosaminidase C-terminal domain